MNKKVRELLEHLEEHSSLASKHMGRTYYKIHPSFAALNGLSPDDVKLKDEYNAKCFHCYVLSLEND